MNVNIRRYVANSPIEYCNFLIISRSEDNNMAIDAYRDVYMFRSFILKPNIFNIDICIDLLNADVISIRVSIKTIIPIVIRNLIVLLDKMLVLKSILAMLYML